MPRNPCSLPDCTRPRAAQGLCNTHVARIYRRGTIELQPRPTTEARFLAKIAYDTGTCWRWTGSKKKNGYGSFGGGAGTELAHRWAYKHFIGPIPEGLSVDHTCHNVDPDCPGRDACLHRSCVNPAHLEAVPQAVNVLRSALTPVSINVAKTHCRWGHPFSGDNLVIDNRGSRTCRTCIRERKQRAKTLKVVA
jgi:hypothetical protein